MREVVAMERWVERIQGRPGRCVRKQVTVTSVVCQVESHDDSEHPLLSPQIVTHCSTGHAFAATCGNVKAVKPNTGRDLLA